MINYEGGAIPEEYLVEYVVDRVETTADSVDGNDDGLRALPTITSTIRSSRKSFISSSPSSIMFEEKGLDGRTGNAEPFLQLPTDAQQARDWRSWSRRLNRVRKRSNRKR